MKDLSLPYKSAVESQNIDIAKLRPNKSYDYLIENRNASLADLLKDKSKLKEFLKHRPCPACAVDQFEFQFSKDGLDIGQCKSCQTVYVNPVFDESKYVEIYQSAHYQTIVKQLGEESHQYRRERFGRERAGLLEQYHKPGLPKRFLEIGCSTGFVLEEVVSRGWEAMGIELNPSAAAFARGKGLTVHSKPLGEIAFEQPFSAIGLFDVLEHLISPADILRQVRDLLLPGGNVFIYVPNYNSASKEILGVGNAHFIWPTHHLTYFTPHTLRAFLERNGFDVLHWETQGLDLVDIDWYLDEKTDVDTGFLKRYLELLQFYINSAGHGKNLRMYATKRA